MLAPRRLPPEYAQWNRRHRLNLALGPLGAALRRSGATRLLSASPAVARECGPFLWQPNSLTRLFEYPWVADTVGGLGPALRIVEVGGGLSGMQWVLAQAGHDVVNVDPGMAAAGRGWSLPRAMHERLSAAFGAEVELREATIGDAGLPDGSVDVLLCVSTLEHMTPEDVAEFCGHVPRLLKDTGTAVITADLFLDLQPFTERTTNVYGRNVDVRRLLDDAGLELVAGQESELLGFPGFAPDAVLGNADRYLRGRYPVFAQCMVARRRDGQGTRIRSE